MRSSIGLIGSVTAMALLPFGHISPAIQQIEMSGPLRNSTLATAGAGDSPATSSFYVYGSYINVCGPGATTECPLYGDGANETVPPTGGMTILDFGAPCFEPVTLAWGTQLFNSQGCTPDATLVILAQAWLRGYETNPNRSASPRYVLVAGTSNSLTAAVPGYSLSTAQMSSHGQAWFTSVISPIAALARSLPTPAATWAGSDIEESSDGNWYDGPTTGAWVDAYAAASGASKPCVASGAGLPRARDLPGRDGQRVAKLEPLRRQRRAPANAVHRCPIGRRSCRNPVRRGQLEHS